ncbi:MAG TPA: hypothetical protein VK832_13470 [Burkholderiaceae bacterium]|jgi:hypothetical protein|nr:hypothetical protein [Burkholderiaceae bacterium]
MKIRIALIAFLSTLMFGAALPSADAATDVAKSLSKDGAQKITWQLPEVKAWAELIEKQSKGTLHGASKIDADTPETIDGKRYWSVTCFVDYPEQIHRWHTFMIRVDGKEILADSIASGNFTQLEKWRLSEKPMQEMNEAAPNAE